MQKVSGKTQRSPSITRQLQSGHYSHWCKSRRNYCSQGVISQITGDKRISLSPDENRANYKGCFQLLFCEFFRQIGESWYAPIPHKTRVSRCVSYVLTPYNEHMSSETDFTQETSQELRMLSRSLSDCKSLLLTVMIQVSQCLSVIVSCVTKT